MDVSLVDRLTQKMRKQRLGIIHWMIITFFVFFITLEIGFLIVGTDVPIIFNFTSIIVNGFFWAALFLSVAIGLNLTYKILNFPNFAHAEYVTIGGFTAIFIQALPLFKPGTVTQPAGIFRSQLLWIAIFLAFVVSGIFAVVADYLIFRKLRMKNSNADTMMIASLGLALIFRGLLFIRFTGKYQYFQPDEAIARDTIEFPTIKLKFILGRGIFSSSFDGFSGDLVYTAKALNMIMVVSVLVVTVILYLFIQKTKMGKAMRAVSDDPGLAASSGINVDMIRNLSTFIGAGIAGMAGAFWAALFRFNPETGSLYLLAGFAVIVLGSIGNFRGAIIASLLIGFARALAEPILTWLGPPLQRSSLTAYRDVVPFFALIFVLLFFSEGVGEQLDKRSLDKKRERIAEREETQEVDEIQEEEN